MVLSEFIENNPSLSFSVLGSDISTRVLKIAMRAVYKEDDVMPVPRSLRCKYLLRSKDRSKKTVRIAPEIRSKVQLAKINLIQTPERVWDPVHVIFCRNVLIYFDRTTQTAVLNMLCDYLLEGGYLFVGHSETLNGLNVPLEAVATTVYRKRMQN